MCVLKWCFHLLLLSHAYECKHSQFRNIIGFFFAHTKYNPCSTTHMSNHCIIDYVGWVGLFHYGSLSSLKMMKHLLGEKTLHIWFPSLAVRHSSSVEANRFDRQCWIVLNEDKSIIIVQDFGFIILFHCAVPVCWCWSCYLWGFPRGNGSVMSVLQGSPLSWISQQSAIKTISACGRGRMRGRLQCRKKEKDKTGSLCVEEGCTQRLKNKTEAAEKDKTTVGGMRKDLISER